MKVIRVKMTVPELDEPFFDGEVTSSNIDQFIKKFDEMIDKYDLDDDFKDFKNRIAKEVKEVEDENYTTGYDLSITRKMTNKHPEEVLNKDLEFLPQCKHSDLFKTAPKEVMKFLDSLDSIGAKTKDPDPNELIEFWVTYNATILTELYSPEFYIRNPKEIIDDTGEISIKVKIPRAKLDSTQAYQVIKKEFVKTLLEDLKIDPNTLGKDFKDSFLARTGIIKLDILGVNLTTISNKDPDYTVTRFMTSVYDGINTDLDVITYRDIETLIK